MPLLINFYYPCDIAHIFKYLVNPDINLDYFIVVGLIGEMSINSYNYTANNGMNEPLI